MSAGWAKTHERPHPLKMPVPVHLFLYWFLDLKQIMNLPKGVSWSVAKIKPCLCTWLIWRWVREAEDKLMGELGREIREEWHISYYLCMCTVSIWRREADGVDACLASKLMTLEACIFPLLLVLAGARTRPSSVHCKLIFSFFDNPYFWNTVIVKEYHNDITGVMWLPVTVDGWWREWMLLLCDPSLSPLSSSRVLGKLSHPSP